MTLIGATKIKNKWTMIVDDGITIGQILTSSADTYRPKLRKIQGKNVELIITGCGAVKDVDFVTNMIEEEISKKKIKNTKELKFFLQQTIAAAHKVLEGLTDKPQQTLLILEPKTDTLFIADEYSVIQPIDSADIVTGSAEQMFYKLKNYYDFFTSFIRAVEADEYCSAPVITYRDGEVKEYWNCLEYSRDEFYMLHNEKPSSVPVDGECLANNASADEYTCYNPKDVYLADAGNKLLD